MFKKLFVPVFVLALGAAPYLGCSSDSSTPVDAKAETGGTGGTKADGGGGADGGDTASEVATETGTDMPADMAAETATETAVETATEAVAPTALPPLPAPKQARDTLILLDRRESGEVPERRVA